MYKEYSPEDLLDGIIEDEQMGETVEVWEFTPTSQDTLLEQGERALKEFEDNKMYYQNLLSFKKKIYLIVF